MPEPIYEYYTLSVLNNLYILGVDLDDVGSNGDNQLNAFSFPVTLESLLAYWAVNRYAYRLFPENENDPALTVNQMWGGRGKYDREFKVANSLVSCFWVPESKKLPPYSSPTFLTGIVEYWFNGSAKMDITYWIEHKKSLARTDYRRAVRVQGSEAGMPLMTGHILIPAYLIGEERIARLNPYQTIEDCEMTEVEF